MDGKRACLGRLRVGWVRWMGREPVLAVKVGVWNGDFFNYLIRGGTFAMRTMPETNRNRDDMPLRWLGCGWFLFELRIGARPVFLSPRFEFIRRVRGSIWLANAGCRYDVGNHQPIPVFA
jgi:hypothetical protein